MNVAILHFSPDSVGLSPSCVDKFKEYLSKNNYDFSYFNINKFNINLCRACGEDGWGICKTEHVCCCDENMNKLMDSLRKFDAFIVVSPVYFWEPTESCKAFIDKLKRCNFNLIDNGFKGKKIILVASAGGSGNGTSETLTSLKNSCNFIGFSVCAEIGITRFNFLQKQVEMEVSIKSL